VIGFPDRPDENLGRKNVKRDCRWRVIDYEQQVLGNLRGTGEE
jgi:hypothetical protein